MSGNPALTPRQELVLEFIRQRISEGLPPTFREISDELGFASPSGAMCHIRALEKKGWIVRDRKLSRAIYLAE